MELGSQRRWVDHDRLFIWVVIEDDDLQQAPRSVCADHKISARSRDHSQGIANCVLHVFVPDTVLACAVRAIWQV